MMGIARWGSFLQSVTAGCHHEEDVSKFDRFTGLFKYTLSYVNDQASKIQYDIYIS